jgi:hypothetical protein
MGIQAPLGGVTGAIAVLRQLELDATGAGRDLRAVPGTSGPDIVTVTPSRCERARTREWLVGPDPGVDQVTAGSRTGPYPLDSSRNQHFELTMAKNTGSDEGRTMPGVPGSDSGTDRSDDEQRDAAAAAETADTAGSATESAQDSTGEGSNGGGSGSTASGRVMPGVPGGSTGTAPEQDHDEGTGTAPEHDHDGGTGAVSEHGHDGGTCGAPEHGGTETVHDLTTVFTFEALTRLERPAEAIAGARNWSDWVGMVGETDVPTMNTFLRRRGITVDFFNGASRPADRLRRVSDTDSSFGSARQVVIGTAAQADLVADLAWEFQDIESVAPEAGWTVRDPTREA